MARVASANEARFTERLVNKQFWRAKIPLRLLWSEWYQLMIITVGACFENENVVWCYTTTLK